MFSDGIFEIDLKDRQEMFIFDEFVQVILDWRASHADRDLAYVLEVVEGLQSSSTFEDDCALMALKFGPIDAAPPPS